LRFPLGHRRVIRTTNLLERLFGEARRRTKVIPHAFGERAVLKLVYAALIRATERIGAAVTVAPVAEALRAVKSRSISSRIAFNWRARS
jgi:transposase-like protein